MDPRYGPPQDGMRAGPPPHQRMPPPRGSMPGRGGFQAGRGPPPVRQHAAYADPYQEQQYGNGFVDERRGPVLEEYAQEGFAPPQQRSMTMPSSGGQYQQQQQHQQGPAQRQYPQQQPLQQQSYPQQQQQQQQPQQQQYQQQQQQQYVAYNPVQEAPPVNFSGPRAYARALAPPQGGYGRESVGALLDEYYNEPDYAEGYSPEPGAQGHYEDPYANAPDHARARSQSDGRMAPMYYQDHGRFDGAVEIPGQMPVEMPGDLPVEAPPVMTANGFPPPPPAPPVQSMPPASAAPQRPLPQPLQKAQRPTPQPLQPQQQFPPRGASVSVDSLPFHPSPASTRFSSDSGRQSDHTTSTGITASTGRHSDLLPAHPPPVRAGLLQPEGTPLPNHPPPRRQYSPERPSKASVKGPLTQAEFDIVRQNAHANPGDQRLQLLLARKMVEAATHLADEGGRADQRTIRRNKENWIYDAHKIVKKLANGVCVFLFFVPPSLHCGG